jgi:hypothetical protein
MMKLVPPKFSSEETKMYNKYFYRYFKPHEFRKLMDSARRRVYKVNTNVVNQGNGFSSLFFVADIIGENVNLDLKNNGAHIKYLNIYGWLGIVEYIEVISTGTISQAISRGSDFGSWGVSLDVCFHISEEQNESGTEEISGSYVSQDQDQDQDQEQEQLEEEEQDYFECDFKEIHKEVVLYEFDLEVSNYIRAVINMITFFNQIIKNTFLFKFVALNHISIFVIIIMKIYKLDQKFIFSNKYIIDI